MQLQASRTHNFSSSLLMKQSQGGMISMLKTFPICFGHTLSPTMMFYRNSMLVSLVFV
jgi:hypothetical protein